MIQIILLLKFMYDQSEMSCYIPILSTDLRWVLALNLGAPDGVRHRPDGKVQKVRVVPLELRVARQTPHEDRIQLLITWFKEKTFNH